MTKQIIITLIVLFGAAMSNTANNYSSFTPGEIWQDNTGVHINAHGGGILYHKGKYYWFGEHKSDRTSAALVGVTCYSSDDLYNWKNEGIALPVVKDNPKHEITEGCVIERPKVIYNAKTRKFVMYFHLELKGQGYNAARVAIAVSDHVAGPYTYLKSLRPNANIFPVNMTVKQRKDKATTADFKDWWTPEWRKAVDNGLFVRRDLASGQMSRDMTLYVDDDGKAYHIYSSEENLTLQIAELTDDYLSYTGKYTRVAPGGHNEAPAIFKKDGKYFMITSGCTGWDPNAARLFSADSLFGVWTQHPNPCIGEKADLTFESQSTYILPVVGKKDAFIFMADRWTPRRPSNARYIWLPIEFEKGLPVLRWHKEWDLSFFDYELVWNDEFDNEGKPNPEFWSYENGFVRNEELQWYQADNANCHNGILTIEGRKETIVNPRYNADSRDWKQNRSHADYTAASIKTNGKKEFLYGRFEVRAKIPLASGSWPAIWTLGNSMPWPSCGEIDIMEYYRVNGVPHILANAAWGGDRAFNAVWDTQKIPFSHFTEKDKDWGDKFHTWRMDWDEEAIRLYLDDELLNETLLRDTYNGAGGNYSNPFRQPHYILLNLALGGQNGGQPDTTAFPMKYEIDYVRVYQKPKETFAVGDKTFLLNGKPFVIKAAEVHYPRIPAAYWEHRIKMCKALGMNTLCLYVFWNIHEQREGQFDFTGNNDVAAFCRLAQKHGMYVIVRPGPYVCAEWEMGGLPWWLLKKKDIKLRTQDPYFMERVELFMKEVGKQLGDLQLAKGGNILMVQVENEYGSYGKNKPYIAAIRDIVKASGFDQSPLFQCDWNSNFEYNALDDLLWTVNFGTGANIDAQFSRLKQLRPNTPLMCSEFWSGWFDHWGAQHETRSAAELVAGMKEMLDKNISMSLYMTHGGTSFGHWAGSNFPGYVPDCTSYDYDAPINESGKATPKYYEVRKLLQNYLSEGEYLPDVPDSIPTIEIPSIAFTEAAPLFDNLPEAKSSEDIYPMEYFDQGWGSILYRTTLKKSKKQQILKVTEAHDYAQIYIDGKRVGILNRLKGDNKITLPALHKNAVLDILVEAMGRRNFGEGVLDIKGITDKVELISDNDTLNLKNWQVYSYHADLPVLTYKPVTASLQTLPAYYHATFTLDSIGDTFIDMTNWQKGMVYVNGHNLGRYWEIGPQQALYLPGCWLKKGENEIVVLEISGVKEPTVSGLNYPILNVLRGNGAYKHRKPDETLRLTDETPITSGTFQTGNAWQTVPFGKNVPCRYFCLEALNAYDQSPYAAIAEIELLDSKGNKLSRQHWKVIYADSEEADDANNVADNVFDLQESTIWHTAYSLQKDPFPHQIVIDLGEEKTVSGFQYLPRMESNKPGMIKDYKAYVKTTPFRLQ
jgi:beta-galactosidase